MGCKILAIQDSKIKVIDDDGKEISINTSQVEKQMHYSSINSVEDMITLGDLQEYAILRNLHIRYLKNLIYVRISKCFRSPLFTKMRLILDTSI